MREGSIVGRQDREGIVRLAGLGDPAVIKNTDGYLGGKPEEVRSQAVRNGGLRCIISTCM